MNTPTSSPSPVSPDAAEQHPLHDDPHDWHTSRLAGPPWYTAVGNTCRFMRRPLDFNAAMRAGYGDVVTVPTLVGPLTMTFHPEGVRHVIQERHLNFDKNVPDDHVLGLLLGKGRLEPAFHRARVARFGALMTEATLVWLDRLEADGAVAFDPAQRLPGAPRGRPARG
jgi:hypothetical protein